MVVKMNGKCFTILTKVAIHKIYNFRFIINKCIVTRYMVHWTPYYLITVPSPSSLPKKAYFYLGFQTVVAGVQYHME